MKDIQAEMKNNIQGINCRVDAAKNQNSKLEYSKANNT